MVMGRKKQFTERLTLPLPEGTTGRIDALLDKGEARLDLIREAIDKEVRRRERLAPRRIAPKTKDDID
jgi:hypothetical protein